MRLKIIPYYIPPNYLSVLISSILVNNDYTRPWEYIPNIDDVSIKESEIVQFFQTDNVINFRVRNNYDAEYIQLKFDNFRPSIVGNDDNYYKIISKMKTSDNYEFDTHGWSPEYTQIFTRNIPNLDIVKTFLRSPQGIIINNYYKSLRTRRDGFYSTQEIVNNDLWKDYLQQEEHKPEGDPFYLIQVILIKTISHLFHSKYIDWNFEDTESRELRYFEYINPLIEKNISFESTTPWGDLPAPENAFFMRKSHLYLNQDVTLPVIYVDKYLTNEFNEITYNICELSEDTEFKYLNYNPQQDLALLMGNHLDKRILVFVPFDFLKYKTHCQMITLNQVPDNCRDYMDINNEFNTIDFLNFINKETLGYASGEYQAKNAVLGLAKRRITDLIIRSGLKLNETNFPTLYANNIVSDKGTLLLDANDVFRITMRVTVLDKPTSSDYNIIEDDIRNTVNKRYLEFRDSTSLNKFNEFRRRRRWLPFWDISSYRPIHAFQLENKLITLRRPFPPLWDGARPNFALNQRLSNRLTNIPYYILIVLYYDLYYSKIKLEKKTNLITQAESEIDEDTEERLDRLRSQGLDDNVEKLLLSMDEEDSQHDQIYKYFEPNTDGVSEYDLTDSSHSDEY